MQIEIKRTVKKEVEETIKLDLIAYWLVRIIRTFGVNNKEVVDEYCFDHEPTEQEIGECLVKHQSDHIFASVIKNYKFAEGEGENK